MRVGGAVGFDFAAARSRVDFGMNVLQLQYPDGGFKMELMWNQVVLDAIRDLGVELYLHGPFLLNPCDRKKHGWYLRQYKDVCRVADAIGAKGIVLHPGFKKELSEVEALDNIKHFLERVTSAWEGTTILEVDSGSKNGSKVGSVEFVETVCNLFNSPKVKACIDTTHLYCRGIDVWDNNVRASVLKQLESHLVLVHLNVPDEKVLLGSHLDRHNTPFDHYNRDSRELIRDLAGKYPCVLERADSVFQAMDFKMIKLALSIEPGI